ncbi:ankyrin repeat-containing domain protein [Trichoderma camerunense]
MDTDAREENERERYTYLNRFFTINYEDIIQSIPKRHPNTCEWLLDNKVFQDWLSGTGHHVMWLHGYPGMGKSVIARYLVEALEERNQPSLSPVPSMLAFFFCSYRDKQAAKMENLISSLIHQLVSFDPGLGDAISRRFPIVDRSVTENIKNLWKVLQDVINAIQKKTLYIVIDALDELEAASWATFLDQFLNILDQSTSKVRVVITSRNESAIEKVLSSRSASLDLRNGSKNVSDISTYLFDKVYNYGRENSFGEEMCESIHSELFTRSDGMFLWAHLAWEYFIDGVALWTTKLLRQRLENLQHLPPGIDTLYYRILSKVNIKMTEEVRQCFAWILVAARPLSIEEMSIALALRERPSCLADIDIRLNLRNFFKVVCPHLIKVDDKGLVSFVHQSFAEFLRETNVKVDIERRVSNNFRIDYDKARYSSGLDCLLYLALDDFNAEPEIWVEKHFTQRINTSLFNKYKFLNYSLLWPIHLQTLDDDDAAWDHYAATLEGNDRHMRWAPFNPPWFFLWSEGLKGLLKRSVRHGLNINALSSDGKHIIHAAIRRFGTNWLQDVSFLLDLGADINGKDDIGQTLLHRLIRTEEVEGIKKWIMRPGVNVNSQDGLGQTALHAAARTQQSTAEIIDIIMTKQDVDVNIPDCHGRTPLCLATHWGRKQATMSLLEAPGIDINTTNSQGESPLLNTIIQGWTDVALLLLDKIDNIDDFHDNVGRNVFHWAAFLNMPEVFRNAILKQEKALEAADSRGWTPLHTAADEGDVTVVQLLLDQQVSATSANNFGETALHLAASRGHLGVVKLLISYMPSFAVNTKDFNGWTLLHRALASGRDDMIRFLLKENVDVTRRDKDGRLAISFAAAFAPTDILCEFLKLTPNDIQSIDCFGYSLLHMAAFYSNGPNIIFLKSILQERENKWGKHPIDYSPTVEFSRFLKSHGFTHSKTYLDQQNKLSAENEEYRRRRYQDLGTQSVVENSLIVRPQSFDEHGLVPNS